MSRENQERAKFIHQNVPFLMCLNIQSLRCHRDELKIELETYKNKPTIKALTETWLTKNDDLDDEYNLKHYQTIESKPRIRETRGGVAFYIREGLQYRIIEYHCDLECLIWSVNFGIIKTKNFCVVYRPHSIKTRFFLNEMEKLLEFL